MTGFCSDPRFVDHDTGPHHPERPDRIRAICCALENAGLLPWPNPFAEFEIELGPLPRFKAPLVNIPATPADEQWIDTVHEAGYRQKIRHVCELGGGVLDLGDTPVCEASYELALLALGGVLNCCDAVMSGSVCRAFAAIRPPGHHAEPAMPMGFCLLSNVAIAARYLQRKHGVERIAIVDFDVHHGNGTQAAFDEDSSVYFISLHQDPRTCYPGSGHDWEIGVGKGRGFTLNIPMQPGCGDAEYLRVMDTRVVPELEEFAPQFLLISAGFDAHASDPLAGMQVSEEGFELMTRSLVALAERHCHGRIVSALEGGYDLRALGRSVVRHIAAMM